MKTFTDKRRLMLIGAALLMIVDLARSLLPDREDCRIVFRALARMADEIADEDPQGGGKLIDIVEQEVAYSEARKNVA